MDYRSAKRRLWLGSPEPGAKTCIAPGHAWRYAGPAVDRRHILTSLRSGPIPKSGGIGLRRCRGWCRTPSRRCSSLCRPDRLGESGAVHQLGMSRCLHGRSLSSFDRPGTRLDSLTAEVARPLPGGSPPQRQSRPRQRIVPVRDAPACDNVGLLAARRRLAGGRPAEPAHGFAHRQVYALWTLSTRGLTARRFALTSVGSISFWPAADS
jgi:hypothetical protein